MSYWRAVDHQTGEVLATTAPAKARSFQLVSHFVDLREVFRGQGATVTLECICDGEIVERQAPPPEVEPLTKERIEALTRTV